MLHFPFKSTCFIICLYLSLIFLIQMIICRWCCFEILLLRNFQKHFPQQLSPPISTSYLSRFLKKSEPLWLNVTVDALSFVMNGLFIVWGPSLHTQEVVLTCFEVCVKPVVG